MNRKTLLFALAVILVAVAAFAATTTQEWVRGWDKFGEPLNLTQSDIKWSLSTARKLTVIFGFVGAGPSKLYQVSINFFCSTFPANLVNFPPTVAAVPVRHSRLNSVD
jgi:hypothetical protein